MQNERWTGSRKNPESLKGEEEKRRTGAARWGETGTGARFLGSPRAGGGIAHA